MSYWRPNWKKKTKLKLWELDDEAENLCTALDDLEQYARKNSLEIGIPDQCYSITEEVVLKLASVFNVTFHGKTYINAFPLNGLKRLLVVCLPLKEFRKSLEALERLLKFLL